MPRKIARWLRMVLCLAMAVPFAHVPSGTPSNLLAVASAHADDDDDGDDDDDDGSDGMRGDSGRGDDSGTSGLRRLRLPDFGFSPRSPRRDPPAGTRRANRPAVIPLRVSGEVIALGLDETSIQGLLADGFAVAGRTTIALTRSELVRLRIPSGITLDAARDRARNVAAGAAVDFNHYYRPEQDRTSACEEKGCALMRHLVGWSPEMAGPGCSSSVRIGLIDTAINRSHEALSGARLEVLRLDAEGAPPSGAQHGTAVAALLVGAADSRAPGLVPLSQLFAVDAFRRSSAGTELASAFDLVRALDELAQRDVRVVNLSLAGPHNDLLEKAVAAMTGPQGTVLIAAVGNAGSSAAPQFPAAYETVIAVTAIDTRRKVYRRAGRGNHVDLAAPGVNVWTAASVAGARPKTGTSFAAPFVTAAAALLLSEQPSLSPREVAAALSRDADDIGTPGKDAIFGWGLLNVRGLCAKDRPDGSLMD